MISITVTFMFYIFFQFSGIVHVFVDFFFFFFFSLSIFLLSGLLETVKSTRRQVLLLLLLLISSLTFCSELHVKSYQR